MEEAPPPIPPPELPPEALSRLVDEGNVEAVERALREQNVRLPAVLDQVERVLALGHGNLAAALATMLIGSFRIARADRLAERVLGQQESAGSDELADLAAALSMQERLNAASKVLEVLAAREPGHPKGLYLRARIHARRGRIQEAFDTIAKVSPKLLGPRGLAVQARYAVLAGRDKAVEAALKLARKGDDPEAAPLVAEVERLRARFKAAGPALVERARTDLRAMMALEYGSVVVELASDAADGGRFGMDPPAVRDVGRTLARAARAVELLGLSFGELLYATEDGEIVAAALSERTGAPYRQWRADRPALEGSWLCMASAGTHPHLPAPVVKTLHEALEQGSLRSLALLLPCGWRGPMVPDVIGRISGDDELPWALDDEVDEVLARMKDEAESLSSGVVREDQAGFEQLLSAVRPLCRATQPAPRAPHVPFFDETPIPRAG